MPPAPRLVSAGSAELAASARLGDAWRAIAGIDDPALRDERSRMRDLLATRPEPLIRTERPGHLTGSAFVVDAAAQHTLM
ncbi:MAG: hypothetical protein AAF548_20590, partial [Actinomycetota bacterium]